MIDICDIAKTSIDHEDVLSILKQGYDLKDRIYDLNFNSMDILCGDNFYHTCERLLNCVVKIMYSIDITKYEVEYDKDIVLKCVKMSEGILDTFFIDYYSELSRLSKHDSWKVRNDLDTSLTKMYSDAVIYILKT